MVIVYWDYNYNLFFRMLVCVDSLELVFVKKEFRIFIFEFMIEIFEEYKNY